MFQHCPLAIIACYCNIMITLVSFYPLRDGKKVIWEIKYFNQTVHRTLLPGSRGSIVWNWKLHFLTLLQHSMEQGYWISTGIQTVWEQHAAIWLDWAVFYAMCVSVNVHSLQMKHQRNLNKCHAYENIVYLFVFSVSLMLILGIEMCVLLLDTAHQLLGQQGATHAIAQSVGCWDDVEDMRFSFTHTACGTFFLICWDHGCHQRTSPKWETGGWALNLTNVHLQQTPPLPKGSADTLHIHIPSLYGLTFMHHRDDHFNARSEPLPSRGVTPHCKSHRWGRVWDEFTPATNRP